MYGIEAYLRWCFSSPLKELGTSRTHSAVIRCLKMPSKLIRILRITFCYKQLCGRCLVHMTPVVKVVIHCVFPLL